MEGVRGDISRLGPRRFRLHHPHVPARRYPAKLHREPRAPRRARNGHARLPSGRRHRSWNGRRSLGPQGAAHVLDPLVFDVRLSERVFDELLDAVRVPRALRHRDGRRLGRGYALDTRALASASAWDRVRSTAKWLFRGIRPVVDGFPVRLPIGQRSRRSWLADDALDWNPAGAAGLLDYHERPRESGVARTPAPSR